MDGVLQVIYLIFNEGYGASSGESLIRRDLTAEAIRLGRVLVTLMPDEPEALGLLALMLLHDARRPARVGENGELVLLDDQDRARWDARRHREGAGLVERALRMRAPGPYQLQAAIAALHDQAATPQATDWHQIAGSVRRTRTPLAVARRGPERRGRTRDGCRNRDRAGPDRRDRCRRAPRRLPVPACRPRGPPAPPRSGRRGSGRL